MPEPIPWPSARDAALSAHDLLVVAWPDPAIDSAGHDPRATYARRFWLPTLGPSTLLLMALLVERLEREADGFRLDPVSTAKALGLGASDSRHAPFGRSLLRLVRFHQAEVRPDGAFAVRRRLPLLTHRQVTRLPDGLAAAHDAFLAARPRPAPIPPMQRSA
jgi:hypothetical protein